MLHVLGLVALGIVALLFLAGMAVVGFLWWYQFAANSDEELEQPSDAALL